MVNACASRRARYERLGRPGSNPCTMSYPPRASASDRFARTPTGTPMRLRRETGTAGPSAITSWPPPSSSARRPAIRSAARVEGASTVTSYPSARSSRAIPATCSLTSWGRDQANGVTRQTRRPIRPESSPRRRETTAPAKPAPPLWSASQASASALALGRLLRLLARVLADELLGQVARLVVAVLHRRRLHQVGARPAEPA